MTTTAWLLLAGGLAVVLYAGAVIGLLATGRQEQARALAGFVPDCAVLVGRLSRDPRVGRGTKLLLVATALYLASPIDLVPDFIPVVGQLDDALLVIVVLRTIARRAGVQSLVANWPGPESSLSAVLSLAGLERGQPVAPPNVKAQPPK